MTPLALFPHRANYVSELEGFEYYGEWIYRQAGCLGTRKFVDDMALIKNIKRVTDRYEWQRENVHEQIEQGTYILDMKVHVEELPNAKNFIYCGEGHLHHDKDGFKLTFTDYETKSQRILTVKSNTLFSIHTEYDYRGKGQCVTLSTPDNNYFIYPLEDGFNATKIQFATELFT